MQTINYYLTDDHQSISAHLCTGIVSIIRPHYNNLILNQNLSDNHSIKKIFYTLEKAAGKASNPKYASIQLIGTNYDSLNKELANSLTKDIPNDKYKEKTAWIVQALGDDFIDLLEQINGRLNSLPSDFFKCIILQAETEYPHTQKVYNILKTSVPSKYPIIILEANKLIVYQIDEDFKIELNRFTSSVISALTLIYPSLSSYLNDIRQLFPIEHLSIKTAILKFIKKYTQASK